MAEFEAVESIYKIISHEVNNTFIFFELSGRRYYVGYPSSDAIKVDFKVIPHEGYLLVGVDLQAVVLSIHTGRILFSIGLNSYFKGFSDTSELAFTILSERTDYLINKQGLSIGQIIHHDLAF
jgi:hypothetical protein